MAEVPRLAGLPRFSPTMSSDREILVGLTDRLQIAADLRFAAIEKEKAALEEALAAERDTSAKLREEAEAEKANFAIKLAEVLKEIEKQRSLIDAKMEDVRSLKTMRDEELLGFSQSVTEFNRQLEEERLLFNSKLQELNDEKRKQLELLTFKIDDLHRQQEKEKMQLAKDIAAEKQNKSILEQRFAEKDELMQKLIDEYTQEMNKLKLENEELKTVYEEAKKSIIEFMSQIVPEDDSNDIMDESITKALKNIKKKNLQHNKTMMSEENNRGSQKISPLTRRLSNPNIGEDEINSPISPILTSPDQEKTPDDGNASFNGFNLHNMTSQPQSQTVESVLVDRDLQRLPTLNSQSFADMAKQVGDLKEVVVANTIESDHSVDEDRMSSSIIEEGPLDAKGLFKLGREINLPPPPKRLYKQKVPEITNLKDAKGRIKLVCDYHMINLSRGRPL
jgi:chromosome segregation ATPase